jgi:hypothetical protein
MSKCLKLMVFRNFPSEALLRRKSRLLTWFIVSIYSRFFSIWEYFGYWTKKAV